jgi:hypothetical protein
MIGSKTLEVTERFKKTFFRRQIMNKKNLALALAAVMILPSWNNDFARTRSMLDRQINPAIYINSQSIDEEILPEQQKEVKRDLARRVYDYITQFKTDDFRKDPIDYLIARLMMGEREGYPDVYKITDAWTPLTRAVQRETDMRTEILRYKQYSCFNEGTDSNQFLKNPWEHNKEDWMISLELARNFIDGSYPNPMPGATHYLNPKKVRKMPDWVNKMTFLGEMKDHFYYKEMNSKNKLIDSFSEIINIQKYLK